MKRFPRVLLVTKSQIGDIDSGSAALRSWFKEWPRDHLAQVFSGGAPVANPFCSRNLQIGPDERRCGRLFFKLKGSSLADTALPYRRPLSAPQPTGAIATAARSLGNALIESGLWELAFTPELSRRLNSFVREFNPEAMFVQGCDITFMRLPLLIRAEFGTPIHFDIVDDWVAHLYRGSWLGPVMGRVVKRAFGDLVRASARRYTIGESMAEEYRARYGVPFQPLMQCDDQERFSLARSSVETDDQTVRIVYSGSLALNRWKALLDLSQACAEKRFNGRRLSITVYAPFVPMEAVGPLQDAPHLTVKAAVPDAEVPAILAGADLLFLPESFDPAISNYIKLSVSTKAHLYMMSMRPTLVYGPPGIGTVEYARRYGWAHVLDREGPPHLAAAVQLLLEDAGRRAELVRRGAAVATKFHAGSAVREDLRRSLLATVT